MDKRAIGVFDSGLGGLTVLREIISKLPNENTIYFGDTARVPYGPKTKEQVLLYTMEIIEFLISKNVKAIVIACNTATVSALKEVREMYNIPIIGVVNPGARAVSRVSRNKKVLVLGTERTISSGAYESEILKENKNINVISKACPDFVSLVEDDMCGTDIAYSIVNNSLKEFKGVNIDSIVLGCTHYPYLRKEINKAMDSGVVLVDPAIETVEELKEILNEKKILNLKNNNIINDFYVSGNSKEFKKNMQKFMNIKVNKLLEVECEETNS